jgi:hypothetical protein
MRVKNILTFIIPVRHQDNATDWRVLKRNLADTIRSIAKQDGKGWKAVVVANDGADLPEMPSGFEVERVDFPPNQLYRQGNADKEQFYDAIRIDKGRRILAGMLHAGEMGHVMIVDDDDFVSRRLTSFVAKHPDVNGWYFRDGYVWSEGGSLLYLYPNFSRLCGTSHIVRSDLYNLPDDSSSADESYIRRILGSHIFLEEHLEKEKKPLDPLPFEGAIYRTGHPGTWSRSKGISQYFLTKGLLKHPIEFFKRLTRLRLKSREIEEEFGMDHKK